MIHFTRRPFLAMIYGLLLLSLLGAGGGCSRQFWRQQADCEAVHIIAEKTTDPRWELKDYRFEAKREARFFSPYDKDNPPMPQDDPTAYALMQCVYGKRGWKGWTKNGVVKSVENPDWERFLPTDDEGNVVLNRETAIEIALTNSPDYQTAQENLYLSALRVSLERFAFDTHFALGGRLNYGAWSDGTGSLSFNSITASASKKLATGGQLVTEIANSIVWNFGSGPSRVSTSLLSTSLVQPLLRYGGRAYALESLTATERALVMNVRQMERYRQGFYFDTIAGNSGISSPGSSGMPSAGSNASAGGGLYDIIIQQIRLANQRSYVNDLRDNFFKMEAMFAGGRINRTQVDQTQQSLLAAQSSLLQMENNHQNSLDSYKMQLGLPPAMNVKVEDPLLENFILILPVVSELRLTLTAHQKMLRENVNHIRIQQIKAAELDGGAGTDDVVSQLDELNREMHRIIMEMPVLFEETEKICDILEEDFVRLEASYPDRMKTLKILQNHHATRGGSEYFSAISPETLDKRVDELKKKYEKFQGDFRQCQAQLSAIRKGAVLDSTSLTTKLTLLNKWIDNFSSLLLELSLTQAGVRLDSIMLAPLYLEEVEALQTAREHRLDWMNARAALVDQWRQIEIRANALKSDVTFRMEGGVTNVSSKASGSNTISDLSVGLTFDAPLTRKSERNAYISALITYDSSRRSYMRFEDTMHRNIRVILRQIELAQLNFELQRVAVLVAMSRVDQENMKMLEPPKVGQTTSSNQTLSRDLVDSLNSLMSTQNTFINQWTDYEAYRMSLDIALGTFKLDNSGIWVDPGSPLLDGRSPAKAMTANSGGITATEMPDPPDLLDRFDAPVLAPELQPVDDAFLPDPVLPAMPPAPRNSGVIAPEEDPDDALPGGPLMLEEVLPLAPNPDILNE